jgi:putative GTP pyrophosphokinase
MAHCSECVGATMATEHRHDAERDLMDNKEVGTPVVANSGALIESVAAATGLGAMQIESVPLFDFQEHERASVAEYLKNQSFYTELASVVARILEQCLKTHDIKVHSVQHRAKDPKSLGRKAAIPSEIDPARPKYDRPIKQITDLAGIRIITQLLGTLPEIDKLLHSEFDILEQSDKGRELIEKERFGYQSIHYLAQIKPERVRLAEYQSYDGAVVEIQVRTILQHAWAEIEHDIQYKSSTAIPEEIRRRFMALAGMLEIADREFQAIQGADQQIADRAREMVDRGDLSGVEITPLSLKQFLDKKLGPDGRISEWAYDWDARLLKTLGFTDLKQIETAIAPYDDNQISILALGNRQGQLTRLELMLLAALGERFIERHPWRTSEWFSPRHKFHLQTFGESGIITSIYDPMSAEVRTA